MAMLGMGGKKNKDGRDLDGVSSLLSALPPYLTSPYLTLPSPTLPHLTFPHVTRTAFMLSSTFSFNTS
jgi:hypothetical protein